MPVYVTPVFLNVGPFAYGLVFVDGFIPWRGRYRGALARCDLHKILVSKLLSQDQMVHAIARELSCAWEHHWPEISLDEEDVHDRFGLKVLWLLKDLAVQVVPNQVLR